MKSRYELQALLSKYDILYDLNNGSIGVGWHSILDTLIYDLIELGWDKELIQIKEKLGGMRFYPKSKLTNQMQQLIYDAEDKSYTVCETCGAPGKTRGRRWVYTACDNCIDPALE